MDTELQVTPPETNIAPENRSLEKEIPIGNHHFQVRTVSFREGKRFIFQVASPQAQLVEYFIGRLEGTSDMDSPAAQRQKSVGAVRVLVRMEGPQILGP